MVAGLPPSAAEFLTENGATLDKDDLLLSPEITILELRVPSCPLEALLIVISGVDLLSSEGKQNHQWSVWKVYLKDRLVTNDELENVVVFSQSLTFL